MIYVEVKEFKCKNCGSEEYAVINLEPIEIICDECGEEYIGEYTVEEVEEQFITFISLYKPFKFQAYKKSSRELKSLRRPDRWLKRAVNNYIRRCFYEGNNNEYAR